MSVDHQVFVGWYFIVTLKPTTMEVGRVPICSKVKTHTVVLGRFCPACGAPVKMESREESIYMYYRDVFDAASNMDDREFLDQFTSWNNEHSGLDDNEELLWFKGTTFDPTEDSQEVEIDLDQAKKSKPTAATIKRLKKLMGTTKVVVKYGVSSVSY